MPYVHQPLQLAFVNGSVVGEAGPILQGLPSTARGSELEGGVLLSLASPDGPVSSTSFRLGKVGRGVRMCSCCACRCSRHC